MRAVMANLFDPLGRDIVEGRRVNNAVAKHKYISLRVTQGSAMRYHKEKSEELAFQQSYIMKELYLSRS